MSDNGNDTGTKLAILIALAIVAIFVALWVHEHWENPEERHTQKLEPGKIYLLEYSDPCKTPEPVELYVKSVSQDMQLMIASVRLEIDDAVSVRDTVYSYALYHAGISLQLRVHYCGKQRLVGYIWSANEGVFGIPGFVKLRMEKGYSWREKIPERK